MDIKSKIILISGPTASGKSKQADKLAKKSLRLIKKYLSNKDIKNIGARSSKSFDFVEPIFFKYLKNYLKNKFSISLGNSKYKRFYVDRSINGIGEILVRQT